MGNKGLQINVAPGQTAPLLFGNTVQELTDETNGKFHTNSIPDFIEYLKENVKNGGSPCVFYSTSGCTAYANIDPEYTTIPIAHCAVEATPILKFLRTINGQKMNLATFEEAVRVMRNYLSGDSALKLLDFIGNVQVAKIKTVSRQKDNSGNFNFTVSSTAGPNDYVFPKELFLSVPMVRNCKDKKEIPFDFFFGWDEKNETVDLIFQLKNIQLDEIIDDTIAETIIEKLKAAELWAKRGSFEIVKETNAWKHKQTPLEIKGF